MLKEESTEHMVLSARDHGHAFKTEESPDQHQKKKKVVASKTLETLDSEEIHPPSDIRTGENTGIYEREKMQVHKITSNTTSTEETTVTTKTGFF